MKFFVVFFTFFYFSSLSSKECVNIEKSYMAGDYQSCLNMYKDNLNDRCKYIISVCGIGIYDYIKARYILSKLSVTKGEYAYYSLNSLVEIAFLTGEFKKARELAFELNNMLKNEQNNSYYKLVSDILFIKSCFDSKDIYSALKRVEKIKHINTDNMLVAPFF